MKPQSSASNPDLQSSLSALDRSLQSSISKPRYDVLDGLRGVAALMVLVFHVFDACSENIIPHGYLAVDMFFVLSGFVIGYSYDSRWAEGLTVGRFFRRRLIRLHPMVLVGALIGTAAFLIQGSVGWDGTPVSFGRVMLAMCCTMLMIPALPGTAVEVRGFGEFFPLNGPFWSLFYEYIGNILYALLLRRLSTRLLTVVSASTGLCVAYAAITNGYLGFGWGAADGGWWFGFVRMLFPYTVGMIMARNFRPMKGMKHAFLWCSLTILLVGFLPVSGGESAAWVSGLYDFLCVALVFPTLVWMGASDGEATVSTRKFCLSMGELSYPLYTIHYPFMSLFFAYMGFDGNLLDKQTVGQHWPIAVGLVVACPLLAWLLLKVYEKPVRRRLSHMKKDR